MINILFSAGTTAGMWCTLSYGCGWERTDATMLSIAWGLAIYYVIEYWGEDR